VGWLLGRKGRRPMYGMKGGQWGASQATRRERCHLNPLATRGLRTGDYVNNLAPSRKRDQKCKRRRRHEGSVTDHENPGSWCRRSKAHN
jgi:hypothetical protein